MRSMYFRVLVCTGDVYVISVQLRRKKLPSLSDCDKEMQHKMYAQTHNANKRIKRRDTTIQEQKEQIAEQVKVIQKYKGMKPQIWELKSELSRVTHRASYWKSKVLGLKEGNSMQIKELYQEMKELKENVLSLELSKAELNEELRDFLSSEEITTFEKGKYTDSVRACVYELLSPNVGVRNIAPTIRCVMKNLAQRSFQAMG